MKNKLCVVLLACSFALAPGWGQAEPGAIEVPLHNTTGQRVRESLADRGTPERPDRSYSGVGNSKLTIFPLADGKQATAAVVVCPGGGYGGLAYDREGAFPAKWFRERGVVGAVLKYRVGGGPNQHPAPMQDVQSALQAMRSRAKELNFPADKLGVMGFSAGGHLAATAATKFADSNEGVSSRPNFAMLVYPVISMEHGITHGGSRRNLLGSDATEDQAKAMSADLNVSKQTPPTFLIHTADDRAVPVENSIRFYRACRQHGVPVEMHLFQKGSHGYGMWNTKLPVRAWPTLLAEWMRHRGLMAGE